MLSANNHFIGKIKGIYTAKDNIYISTKLHSKLTKKKNFTDLSAIRLKLCQGTRYKGIFLVYFPSYMSRDNEISTKVVCATSKSLDLIRAFASCLNIL